MVCREKTGTKKASRIAHRLKLSMYVLALIVLLCACRVGDGTADASQQNDQTETSAVTDSPEQIETDAAGPGVSDEAPLGSTVRDVPFTETKEFPFPFEGEAELYEITSYQKEVRLTLDQALYDYDTMWLLLEENFPFLEQIKTEQGIDWEEIRDQYRERIISHYEKYGFINNAQFYQMIKNSLMEFNSVGHLFAISKSEYEYRCELFGGIDFDHTRELYRNLYTLLSNPTSALVYNDFTRASWENVKRLGGSGGTGGSGGVDSSVDYSEVEQLGSSVAVGYTGGVPYVKMSSFDSKAWNDEVYAGLERFFREIKGQDHLILDIRGNSGGSDGTWKDGILPYLVEEPTTNRSLIGRKAGSLSLWLDPDPTYGAEQILDDSWREDFPDVPVESVRGLDILFERTSTFWPVENRDDYFRGKVWLLVDRGDYSAADTFAYFCKYTGFATLVGVETGGNGVATEPHYMALPYSGLIVEYGPTAGFNVDGTSNGVVGTMPDIFSESGPAALDTCLAAIRGED